MSYMHFAENLHLKRGRANEANKDSQDRTLPTITKPSPTETVNPPHPHSQQPRQSSSASEDQEQDQDQGQDSSGLHST